MKVRMSTAATGFDDGVKVQHDKMVRFRTSLLRLTRTSLRAGRGMQTMLKPRTTCPRPRPRRFGLTAHGRRLTACDIADSRLMIVDWRGG